jgi:hypothetical protein
MRLPIIKTAADIAKWCKKHRMNLECVGGRSWNLWSPICDVDDPLEGDFWGRTAQSAIRKAAKAMRRRR